VCSCIRSNKTSHTVSDKHNVVWVDAKFLHVLRVAEKLQRSLRVLEGVRERKRTATSPCSTIEGNQHIPARTPHRVGQIQVFFVSGEAMYQQHRRMRSVARCNVDDRIELG